MRGQDEQQEVGERRSWGRVDRGKGGSDWVTGQNRNGMIRQGGQTREEGDEREEQYWWRNSCVCSERRGFMIQCDRVEKRDQEKRRGPEGRMRESERKREKLEGQIW